MAFTFQNWKFWRFSGTRLKKFEPLRWKSSDVKKVVKLGVQGAPFELGQTKEGLVMAPTALRNTEFIDSFRQVVKLDVKDYGDIDFSQKCAFALEGSHFGPQLHLPSRKTHRLRVTPSVPTLRMSEVGQAAREIASRTASILEDGRFPLTLGGDHSISIGTVAGVAQHFHDLGVLWIDAHSDINTPLTTSTGKMHGMPVAFLLKEMIPFLPSYPEFSWLRPPIEERRLVYIGLRDVESYEKSFLDLLGIRMYCMAQVDKLGINTVVELALQHLTEGDPLRPIHVSFDVDALDDVEMPCTGTPVPGGLTLREGMTLMERVFSEANFVSMDVVEFNPELGSAFQLIRSAKAVKELIFSSFGYDRGGVAVLDKHGNPTVPLPKPRA